MMIAFALKQSTIKRIYFNVRTRHSVFGKMHKGDSLAQYAGLAGGMRSFESLRLTCIRLVGAKEYGSPMKMD